VSVTFLGATGVVSLRVAMVRVLSLPAAGYNSSAVHRHEVFVRQLTLALLIMCLSAPCARLRARRGVVVAAGVWSGQLLSAATGQPAWQQLLQPRRGHLLEMLLPEGMPPLRTGEHMCYYVLT
jgi:hypothetical protein